MTLHRFAHRCLAGTLALAAALGAGSALAQGGEPIRIVVAFAPGGPIDLGARHLAPLLQQRLQQPVLVENRPGGLALIAANAVTGAPADGRTVFMQSVSVLSPTFIKDLKLDVMKEMEPVAQIWSLSYGLFVRADLPAKDVREFVQYARANPGKLNYGIPTASSMLAMEILKSKSQLDMVGVPYKGSAPTALALLANEIQSAFDVAGLYKSHADAGKVRPLFVTSSQRSPLYPAVATAAELGMPEMTLNLAGGFWVKTGAPKAQTDRLAAALAEALALPETRERFTQIGWLLTPGSGEVLRRNVAAEMEFWAAAAKMSNYKPE